MDLDPKHDEKRNLLRLVGVLMVTIGGILSAIGIGSFFMSFGTFGGPPRLFWCAFLGFPLLGIGSSILRFAFLGTVTRYMAGEAAPVAKDTFNYMAGGTREGVKEVASAIGEGLGLRPEHTGGIAAAIACPICGHASEAGANFCDACGAALPHKKICPACQGQSEPNARFCSHCGRALE